jgi:undecaprenyl-diphosphatase
MTTDVPRQPPHPPRWRRLLRAVGFAAAAGVPVGVLALAVRSQSSPVLAWDEAAISAATAVTRDHPTLHEVLLDWQELFQARWVNLVMTLVCVWAWKRHGLKTRALWAFVTLMASWNLGLLAKLAVQRARPAVDEAVAFAPGYSFPSGHAANTAAAGLTLTLLLWPVLGRRGRVVLAGTVGSAILITGADRVLLGVHYPSDVVAGILFGGALVGASYLGYLGWNPPVPHPHHERETDGVVPSPLRERQLPADGGPGRS